MKRHLLSAALLLLLAACGGGGGSGPGTPPVTPPVTPPGPTASLPTLRATGDTLVAAGCGLAAAGSTLYVNAEVEPFVAINPLNSRNLVGIWQQDRYSNGGARALVSATSFDGGATWQRFLHPFSRCGGAAAGSAGDYERVSDPWVDIGPSGIVYAFALSFGGTDFTANATSGLLASRSLDGGQSWSAPVTLHRDSGASFFNDKNALTADPTDLRYVWGVWDRLDAAGNGPTLMARSIDSGQSWEAMRIIYSPQVPAGSTGSPQVSQTLGNRIVVLPSGALLNVFLQIDTVASRQTSWIGVIRSDDKGLTWGAPVKVGDSRPRGITDPQTGKAVRDGAEIPNIAVAPNGTVLVAWQDASFSGGARDGIALARSSDGGRSWSAPAQVNTATSTQAFMPTMTVRADGLIGLLHYDLRADTADAATLLISVWLLTSRDGLSWTETKVWGPFDLAGAADARGLFVGDYQGLVADATGFIAFIGMSGSDANNRSDIFPIRISPP